MKNTLSFLTAALSTCLISHGAAAQPRSDASGWRMVVGAGALYQPSYVGDDDYRLSTLPNIQLNYGDFFFASVQGGIGVNLINEERLRVGPIARIEFARNEDGDQAFAVAGAATSDLIGLGDVNTTVELGGFVEYDIGPFAWLVEARQGTNGHEGFVADISANYTGRYFDLGPRLIYSIGPRLKLVNDRYNRAYFGVNAEQSAASGLPEFNARGGLYSFGVGGSLIAPLTRDGSLTAVMIAGYDRLTGDAGDAPLVRERGARDQATIGLFLSYRLW